MRLHLVFKIWDFLGYGKPGIKKPRRIRAGLAGFIAGRD
jgi:hypothetical protein